MCLGPEVLGFFQMAGTALSALSAAKSFFGGGQQPQQQVAASSPLADDAKAKADAEGKAIMDKNSRMKLARSASLLSGGAQGDLSAANVATSTSKATLGA